MKLTGKLLRVILAAAVIAIQVTSCGYDETWYPSGSVFIEAYREVESGGTKFCNIFYHIENIGNSKISISLLSVKVVTTEGVYYTTLLNDVPILPGMRIFGSLTLTYFSTTEVTSDEEITVVDYSFE